MRTAAVFGCIMALTLGLTCPAIADDGGEAKSLVEQALIMFKEKGADATLKAINAKDGPFVKGNSYVFALTMDNIMIGHPHEHSIRRINVNNVKDNNGVLLFQRFREVVQTDGSGWVEYLWAKPGSEEAKPKRSFVKKVPGEEIYIGAGYYLK